MRITDALLGEHGLFSPLFDTLDELAARRASPEIVAATLEPVAAAILDHATLEDQLLFPAIEARLGALPPVAVMRHEHVQIEQLVERARHAPDADAAARSVLALLEVVRSHFAKEEQVLFPMIARSLDDAELDSLGEEWSRRRGVALG